MVKDLKALHRRGLRDPYLDDLKDLVEIARQLSSKPTDREMVEDALAQAIDACWGGKREDTPTMRDTMRLWFGLPAFDDLSAPDLRAAPSPRRHQEAWKYLEARRLSLGEYPREALVTFRTSRGGKRYETLARKLIELANAAESQPTIVAPSPTSETTDAAPDALPDDQTSLATDAAPETPLDDPPVPPSDLPASVIEQRYPVRGWLRRIGPRRAALPFSVVLVITASLIVWLTHPSSPSYSNPHTIPPEGAIVNAEDGAVSLHATAKPPNASVGLGGGQIMLACIVTPHPPCHYAASLKVRAGDTVKFSLALGETREQLIPYLKLETETIGSPLRIVADEAIDALTVSLSIEWPRIPHEPEIPDFALTSTRLQFPSKGPYVLSYVSGSTELLTENGHLLHLLPNGILEKEGVALQDVGTPPGCFRCENQYRRYVDFRAKVGLAKF